jgi:hypothetical protein
MNSTLQDIMGLLNRYKTKVPTDNDYIVIAGHTSRGVLVPQPTLEANVTTLGELKKYIQTSAGSTPTLQEVTDEGNTTTNDVKVNSLGLYSNSQADYGYLSWAGDTGLVFKNETTQEVFRADKGSSSLFFVNNDDFTAKLDSTLLTENRTFLLPDIEGTIALTSDIPTPSYKVYTALLTQTGTSAPVAIVLENTLGVALTWIYGTTGTYQTNLVLGNDGSKIYYNIATKGSSTHEFRISPAQSAGDFGIGLQTFNSGVNTNGLMTQVPIEIRVYN